MNFKNVFSLYIVIPCVFLLLFLVFQCYPEIDLVTSALFYTKNYGFIHRNNLFLTYLYYSVYVFSYIAITICIVRAIFDLVVKHSVNKSMLYVLIVMIIGPGIIVNAIFKNYVFGRARPSQVIEFGSHKHFTKAFEISNNCSTNCSFSSGHAASAFCMTAFAFIAKRRKKLIASVTILYGVVIGITRIIQGGHFLSDVLVSCAIVLSVNYLLYRLMFKNELKNDHLP